MYMLLNLSNMYSCYFEIQKWSSCPRNAERNESYMSMKWWKCGGSVALGAVLVLSSQPAVLAANAADVSVSKPLEAAYWNAPSLPVAQAEQKLLEPNQSKVFALPSKQRVYVYTQQPVVKSTEGQETSDSYLYTLQAFNDQTGESLWQYTFQSADGAYATSVELMPTDSGSFYAYVKYTDGTNKLISLSDKGLERWNQNISSGSIIKLMNNGELYVFEEATVRADGTATSVVNRYSDAGKLTGGGTVNGAFVAAEQDRIVMDSQRKVKTKDGWQPSGSTVLDVLNLELKPINNYIFPANANVSAGDPTRYSIHAMNDSTFMLRIQTEGVNDLLMSFNKDGDKQWELTIPDEAHIVVNDQYYVLYTEHSIELYSQQNQIVQRSYTEDTILPGAVTLTSAGDVRIQLKDRYEVLNKINLKLQRAFTTGYMDAASGVTDTAFYAVVDHKLVKQILR